jgi:uncharacterized membrane protein YidH (DUF202 family)
MVEDYSGWLWFLIDVVLVAVLGLAMVYGIWKWRRAKHDPESERARDQATKQVYREG